MVEKREREGGERKREKKREVRCERMEDGKSVREIERIEEKVRKWIEM